MLILIAGITGFVGIPCARSAFARGHKVRGLARNIDNLPADVRDRLEGFETMSDPHDIAAMDRATKGVDAIICSFAAVPEMFMESQMMLIRAAERAGVKTFNFHGPSTFPTRYTTAEDIGNYVLEAITAPDAANGGFVRVQSFEASPEDIVKAYNAARGGRVTAKLNCLGSLKDAEDKLNEGRAKYGKSEWYNYLRYSYQYHIPARSWDYEPVDVARFPNVKQTSLEEFFPRNPDV
ncbi:unnamed protein product [Aspergillus oryzae]|nr:unnamed protein product [Aspergillus oryzae]GMF83518.1 unnamed protein product [Aspergillus oryzae]